MGYNPPSSPVKFDANGNVLANVNAQNINPNVNDVAGSVAGSVASVDNIKLDANGNVLANINAQNITPNANASNIKLDANGNVLANINAQNINPTIANPYTPLLLSHQTGLSGMSSSVTAPVNIGSSITAPRAGILKIRASGYVSADTGYIDFALTSAGITQYFNTNTSTALSGSILGAYDGGIGTGFSNTSEELLFVPTLGQGDIYYDFDLPVESGDVIQFRVSNNTAGQTTYISDLEVILI